MHKALGASESSILARDGGHKDGRQEAPQVHGASLQQGRHSR